MVKYYTIGLLLTLMFLVACSPQEPQQTTVELEPSTVTATVKVQPLEEPEQVEEPVEIEQVEPEPEPVEPEDNKLTGLVVADVDQLANNYYQFSKEHYEQSLAADKIIFLDFHASWCPTCVREHPHILEAFNELDSDTVVGYNVHYKDGKATKDHDALAKKYGISLQHTKVIVKDGQQFSKTLEEFKTKEKVLQLLNAAIEG